MVSVPATGSARLGSNLGPGPPHRANGLSGGIALCEHCTNKLKLDPVLLFFWQTHSIRGIAGKVCISAVQGNKHSTTPS